MTLVEPTREEAARHVGRRILGLWMVLYGFVGTQMTWRLSPFIGKPEDPFFLIKPSRDNFYMDVLHALQQALNLPALNINLDTPLMLAALCPVGLILIFVMVMAFLRSSPVRKEKTAPTSSKDSADPKLETA